MSDESRQDYEVWAVSYGSHRYIAKVRTCSTCGEYKGEMHCPETGETRPLTCYCDGEPCPKCGRHTRIRRGTEHMNRLGLVTHQMGVIPTILCGDCLTKGQAEYRARQAQASATEQAEEQSGSAPSQTGDGREWLKFVDECFPPGPEPKGPFGKG